MTDTLFTIHRVSGYAVFVLVLVVSFAAFNRARNAQEFEPGLFSVTAILVDIQVLLGLALYGSGQYWEGDAPLVQYVHPAVMLAALAAAHIGLGRARREQMAADAHRLVGRWFIAAVVLLAAGIGVATVGGR